MAAIRVTHLASIQVFATEQDRDDFTEWEDGDMAYVVGVGLTIFKTDTWEVIALVSDLA